MSKISKKKTKPATIQEIEALALKGKDTSSYFSKPKRMPPREVHKIQTEDDIIKVNVIIFLKILLREYFINSIHKVFPANVFAFLWSLEFLRQQFKFLT